MATVIISLVSLANKNFKVWLNNNFCFFPVPIPIPYPVYSGGHGGYGGYGGGYWTSKFDTSQ